MPSAAAIGTCESAFWQFSLAFYAQSGVAATCLQLQDDAGVDVNVMLYALFLATHKRQIDRADAARIDVAVKSWRELAVIPLRTLRRRLKTGVDPIPAATTESLRSAVKRIELDAERIEQEWLELSAPAAALGTAATSQITAAQANLASYGELLNGLPNAPVTALLAAYALYVGA